MTFSSLIPNSLADVGAPTAFKLSLINFQSPPYKYIINIVPTPHCSPCRQGLSKILSKAWENVCSDPLAGRLEPAILIAIPLLNKVLTTRRALSSKPGLILSTLSVIIFADIIDNEAADSLYDSFFKR